MIQTVVVFNTHRRHRVSKKRVTGYVQRVLGKKRANVSIVFIDSHYCTSINKKFLNNNYETDVLSFTVEQHPVLEGEIYVNLDKAKKQARAYGVSFGNEVARLVIHGTLHLIGYEDRKKEEREEMKKIENRHVHYWFPATRRNSV